MTKGGKRRKTRRKGARRRVWGQEEGLERDGGALTIRAGTLPGSTHTHKRDCNTPPDGGSRLSGVEGGREELS